MRFDRFLKAAETRAPAMVLQVSWANGLDIIRDLAANGVPLLAADANPRALGLHSRLAAGVVCPDPQVDEEAFIGFLEQVGPRLPRRAVLFPTHDQYIWPISKHAKRLERWYRIPFSRWETMKRLHDKREQLETTSRTAPTRSASRRSSSRSSRSPSRRASAATCSRSARATSSCASTTRCATAAR